MAARRIEQLVRYAAAAQRKVEVRLARLPAREIVEEAAGSLAETGAFVGPLLAHELEDDAVVPVPEDDELRAALLEGWLEAASYGVPAAPLAVRLRRLSADCVELEAMSGGELRRRRDLVSRRIGPRTAAIVAQQCGGRLVLPGERPTAKLLLPVTGAEEED
ncbi:MAG: hypothetical protein J7M26_03860 [Armatimonadetes bacterium]|nr:hypothetical protein [Armatimonadota bacterium]